jgi:hypothetical protein
METKMTKPVCVLTAILIASTTLGACGSYERSPTAGEFRSPMDEASGTPMPTSVFDPAITPGIGDMDQGKRAGTHGGVITR